MFDRRSYLDTISALRADPDKLEEIIKMKENDRRHIPHSLRPVAAVAAALALLGISVGAVNTEPVQEFLYHISTAVQVGVFRQDITTEEGVDLTIYHMPEVSLEDRDGRRSSFWTGRRRTSQTPWPRMGTTPFSSRVRAPYWT